MPRAHGLRLAGIAAALLALGGCAGGPSGRPSVLLIVVDSLRADRLGCYGHERDTSPHVDALAARGLRYERAYSQAPWTMPSVASLLTSRHPRALGIRKELTGLDEEDALLAELLREAGYATGAVVSHHLVGSRWGFAQGFDVFDESQVLGHGGISSPGVSDRAIAFLKAHAREPFFLLLHYFDPHYDYLEHPGFEFTESTPPYRGPIRSGLPYLQVARQRDRMSEADLRELLRLYDSEIAFTDHHIGRVLAWLRRLGLEEETVVVFTADHGEEFLEHGWVGHSVPVYEEVLRVPLLLAVPGRKPGVVERPVALLDVAPTLLELLELPGPASLRGQSLLDPVDAPEPIVAETWKLGHRRALVSGRHKLIHRIQAGTLELYDVEQDPGETRNLRREEPERAAELYADLEAWAEATPSPGAETEVEIPEDVAEELRQLGYLQ